MAIDFSKAFDSVRHELLSNQLKLLPLNACIITWYHSFLSNREQRIVHDNLFHECKGISVFLNDLEINQGSTPILCKHTDDSGIVAPVWKAVRDTSSGLVEKFLTWWNCNSMRCNLNKCKELVSKKKGNSTSILLYAIHHNMPLLKY